MDFKDQVYQLAERIASLKNYNTAHKRITFIDDNKAEINYDLNSLDDICNYRKEIVEAAKKYV